MTREQYAQKLINPKALYDGASSGLSQATIDTESGLVFVSGQVDWNHQYQTTEHTVEGQLRKSLDHLKIVLEEAGSSVDQLLQVRIYIRGEFGEQMQAIAPIVSSFLGASQPAVTGIGVASLVSPDVLVEVEAIASIR